MDILILFITGLGVGILSGFFGVGGGIIIVPTLYAIYPKMESVEVISVSLLTVFLNTLLNNYQFKKLKLSPSRSVILYFCIFCGIGALSGSYLTNYLDSKVLKTVFAIVLLLVVFKTLFYKSNNPSSDEFLEGSVKLAVTSFFGSCLSSMTGLGGGVIYVPLLKDLVKVPLNKIAAYSNMAMMLSVSFALIPHFLKGNVNYKISFILFIGAMTISKFGISLNNKVSDNTKKILLSMILLISSLKILLF